MRRSLLAVAVVACAALEVYCARLSPQSQAQIARDQVLLTVCQAAAHEAKDAGAAVAWAAFDDCMIRQGFYEGGSDAR